MKRTLLLALAAVFYCAANAQTLDSNGRSHANFSIDGDVRNNYQKITSLPQAATSHHDDWFLEDGYRGYYAGGTGLGNSIFDTIGAAAYKAQLSAGENISFIKRMKYAAFDVVPMWKSPYGPYDPDPTKRGFDSSFWVDGVYFRDYASSLGNDITAFSGGKNADDPNTWTIGNSVSNKTDIVDVMTHVRTTGLNPFTDSVWFYAGVSTVQTSGNRFFDIEVYRESFTYDETNKKFTSAGALGGHSPWTFNGTTGAVSRSGDIIISVSYQSNQLPAIDFRIFIAKTTYDSVVAGTLVPATFTIATGNGKWQLNTAGNGGYVQILAKSGATNWGSGVANYVATNSAAQDAINSTPWGTLNSSGAWSQNYDRLQFIEIALNFSRFGMNPFHYVTSFCSSPYSSIIIKSRASTSFNANLEDFVVPQPFTVKNLAPFTVNTDTITCKDPVANLKINVAARNYYRWFNENGDTLSKDSDTTTFKITKPGTYYLEGTNFKGCPAMGSKQTITVYSDSIAPTAKALLGYDKPYYFLNGGDTAMSNQFTPYGRSNGLTWAWTGPNGFTSNVRDPRVDINDEGYYKVTLTEHRNGCMAQDSIYLSSSSLVLKLDKINLTGLTNASGNELKWNPADRFLLTRFDIERSHDGKFFTTIATLNSMSGKTDYSFIDNHITGQSYYYRIKSTLYTGHIQVSNIISINQNQNSSSINLTRNTVKNSISVHFRSEVRTETYIRIHDMNGSLIKEQMVGKTNATSALTSGTNVTLDLPSHLKQLPLIVSVYQNNQLAISKKL